MNEHLFKLKKDGKTVGYYRFVIYRDDCDMELQYSKDGKLWNSGDMIDFNSIHPFVTKDKNGKNVFHADYILANYRGKKEEARIYWDASAFRFFWVFGEKPEQNLKFPMSVDWKDIELIEDKEHENQMCCNS